MKKFTSVWDLQSNNTAISESIDAAINQALAYKKNPWKDEHLGARKRLGLIFINPSLRTRLSTQIAAKQLGMEAIVFNIGSDGWAWELEDGAIMNGSSVEHLKDAVPVLSHYFDILAIRTFPELKNRASDYSEATLMHFIKYATVPIISLESATLHPLQSFTDLVTIKEQQLHHKPKIALLWAPHIKPLPQCVANSFAQWITAWDQSDFVIAQPPGLELAPEFTHGARIVSNKHDALEGADLVYVKNWSSYNDYGKMAIPTEDWQLSLSDFTRTNRAKVMHCLPVRRNIELSDEVLDSPHSIVTEQASNRVWAAQTVIANLLKAL